MVFKEIKLDVCTWLNGIIDVGGNKPTIKQNTRLEVSHNSFLIELKVEALLLPPTDKYVGVVTSLPTDKEVYEGLTIGDQIFFKKENIYSIF
jgi:hypothetical protein